jgi:peptide/nickel transport system substrate-binding protein
MVDQCCDRNRGRGLSTPRRVLDEEKAITRRLNKAAFDHVVYVPLGMCVRHFAYRKNLDGVGRGPILFPWG